MLLVFMLRFGCAPAVTFERIICAMSDMSSGVIGDGVGAGCDCGCCCENWNGVFRPLGKVNVWPGEGS